MATAKRKSGWSSAITESGKLRKTRDLEPGVFTLPDPRKIAVSLRRSARISSSSKDEQFRWAMSMLVLYRNRAGKNLGAARRAILEDAKVELRRVFGREPASARRGRTV